jgi:hypothetical protein
MASATHGHQLDEERALATVCVAQAPEARGGSRRRRVREVRSRVGVRCERLLVGGWVYTPTGMRAIAMDDAVRACLSHVCQMSPSIKPSAIGSLPSVVRPNKS